MQADYALALGREDAALELPWRSDDGSQRYHDLKNRPELLLEIPEAAKSPELAAFLARVNAPAFPVESAKCDTWCTRELAPEEDVFNAAMKFVSYVDLVFVADDRRLSLAHHELLARKLCQLLKRAPEMPASAEFVIRRCYFHSGNKSDDSADGFALTAYISGFGENEGEARKRWAIALTLLQHALVQALR